MADVVKALLAAPVNAVLLVAGLAFLAVAVFRRITERLDAGPKGRLFAGLLGIVLVALSLYLSMDRQQPEEAAPTASAGTSVAPVGASYPIELPAGQEVKGESWTYKILKISLDRHEINQLALTFTIRMHNYSDYPSNFWNASFRLLVDDVPVAPFNELNELVDSNAAKEGAVSFAIPASTRKAALQIDKFGPDAPALPVALPSQP
jgi:Co/Zn/Cd efflux system component